MHVVAVDLGATNLRVALVSDGTVTRVAKTRTPREGPDALLEAIISLIREVSQGEEFEAIGIASIGPLDVRRGLLLYAPNLGYGNVRLRDGVGEEFRKPTYLVNDAVAGAWAEKVLGQGKDLSDLAYVTMSTGLGVGAIVDGNLLVGRRGNAHELGHAVVNLDLELPCGCGGVGHWEAFVGGRNIPSVARRLAEEWKGARTRALELAEAGQLTPELLYSMARGGDEFALYVVDFINRAHAAGMATLIAAYDPEAIFVGGSIFLYNEDLIMPGLLKYLSKYVGVLGVPKISRCTFGDEQVLYGAASVALRPPQAVARDAYVP